MKFRADYSQGYLVNRAAKLLAKALDLELRKNGGCLGYWPYLMFLWEQDGRRQTELSSLVLNEDSTTTLTLKRMVRDQLIEIRPCKDDGRQKRVFLTNRGTKMKEKWIPCAIKVNSAATAKMSEKQKNQMCDLLHLIINSLLEHN